MDLRNVLTAKKTLFANLLKPIFSIKHNLLNTGILEAVFKSRNGS